MAKIDDLKQEATELGISFSPNISETKLADRIENYYKSQESNVVKLVETEEEKGEVTQKSGGKPFGLRVKEAEEAARKTHIIVITDNDQRENNLTSTVPVTCGNQYFDLGLKRIPLNVPVEVEQGFIDTLKEIRIPLSVRQMDGSFKTAMRNRYSISYEDGLKKNDQ